MPSEHKQNLGNSRAVCNFDPRRANQLPPWVASMASPTIRFGARIVFILCRPPRTPRRVYRSRNVRRRLAEVTPDRRRQSRVDQTMVGPIMARVVVDRCLQSYRRRKPHPQRWHSAAPGGPQDRPASQSTTIAQNMWPRSIGIGATIFKWGLRLNWSRSLPFLYPQAMPSKSIASFLRCTAGRSKGSRQLWVF